jgi:hypothetical protein
MRERKPELGTPAPMKHFSALCLTLLLLLPVPAAAQYVMDLANLARGISMADFRVSDFDNLADAQTVYVTRVSRLAGIKRQGAMLDRAIASSRGALSFLRAMVRQNRVAMRALQVHGEALDDVIFLTTTNDGSAMLYVDDR